MQGRDARISTAPEGARVVVVGAGFAGGSLLRNLPAPLRRPGETLLVDRADEHAFIPLIHEVAVGRVHPDTVRLPVSPTADAPYAFLQAEANGVDLDGKVLHTSAGDVRYQYLVLAPGSVAAPPPEGLRDGFQTFWSLGDALEFRGALNEAWRGSRRRAAAGGPTVGIVGGGATGVELAAEVAVLFDYLRRRSARPPADARVVLFEATDRLMGWLDPFFHRVAMEELGRLGVEVRLNSTVCESNPSGVVAAGEKLRTDARVWTTGVRAAPLVRDLPGGHDDGGRVRVTDHLTLPDHPEVYVLGDGGAYRDPRLGPLAPVASLAVQQGPWVARDLKRRLRGASSRRGRPPFRFFDRGYAVSLGPESGAAIALGARLRGSAAQTLYRSVLLYYMKSRRGRILAGADWALERVGRVGFDARGTGRAGRGFEKP